MGTGLDARAIFGDPDLTASFFFPLWPGCAAAPVATVPPLPPPLPARHVAVASMLVPNKMQHVICTGNVGREQYNELCGLAPNVTAVRGDFDDDPALPFPDVAVVQVGQFRIGVAHGHQLLPHGSQDARARMRRKLDVDIFVSGHTHRNEVVLQDGYYHINPVSPASVSALLCFLRLFHLLASDAPPPPRRPD